MIENKYRWESPFQWLMEKADSWDIDRLRGEFKSLASKLDSCSIQDEYQSDMEQDGFFTKVHHHTLFGKQPFTGNLEDCHICNPEEN